MEVGFNNRTFESEEHSLFTFRGHGDYYCIMFNAKCVHAVKTKKLHETKLSALIKKYGLVEVLSDETIKS